MVTCLMTSRDPKGQGRPTYLLSIRWIRCYNAHVIKIESLNMEITYHKWVVYVCVSVTTFTNYSCTITETAKQQI